MLYTNKREVTSQTSLFRRTRGTRPKKENCTLRNIFTSYNEDLEIITQYNSEIRGLYNYYRLAESVSNYMNRFAYFMYYSMLKTYASKYRTRTKQIRKKYEKYGQFTVQYETKKGINFITRMNRHFTIYSACNEYD